MTVEELIKELQKYDSTMRVYVGSWYIDKDGDDVDVLSNVTSVSVTEDTPDPSIRIE